jgi:hypothetical protein
MSGCSDLKTIHGNVFERYLPVIESELGHQVPMLMLRAGACLEQHHQPMDLQEHTRQNLAIAQALQIDQDLPSSTRDCQSCDQAVPNIRIPKAVRACNFWLLASELDAGPAALQAWFQPTGARLPIVDALEQWQQHPTNTTSSSGAHSPARHPLAHYILLPAYAWGAASWDLELVQPFLQKFHATLGFSIEEACLAERVTVVGSEQVFPTSELHKLRLAGCQVERLNRDGTLIASDRV